jgi:hypothetical protein
MNHDPFAHLPLSEIEAAERKYRQQHPILWLVAELVVFAQNPWRYARGWRPRRVLGDGKGR